jgi:Heat shock factor binding protein 1
MSTTIIGRIDEMGNRIDDLEKSIGDLMQQVRFFIVTFSFLPVFFKVDNPVAVCRSSRITCEELFEL